jgi:hypothetical protein
MLDQLRDTDSLKTHVSFLYIFTSIGLSVGCMMFPNLNTVFGDFENAGYRRMFAFAFYHGFDAGSAAIHLVINIILTLIVVVVCEKVLGRLATLIMLVVYICSSGIILKTLSIAPISATGFVFVLLPTLQFILLESRRLKTRTAYEDYFRFLRTAIYITVLLLPLIYTALQFLLRGDINFTEALKQGIGPFAIAYITGIALLIIFRNHIKSRLKTFLRKKKFDKLKTDNLGDYLMWGLPLYLVIAFLIR